MTLLDLQSFSEVPDQSGMPILSVTPKKIRYVGLHNAKFHIEDCQNVHYSEETVISESVTS